MDIKAPRLLSNFRNISAAVHIHAPPAVVWGLLTDYERLAEVVPSLAVNRVLDRWEGGARLFQVSESRRQKSPNFIGQIEAFS